MNLPKQLHRAGLVVRNAAAGFYHDSGYFLAMGLAFNLQLYFLPLILLMISLLAYTVLESQRAMVEVQSVVRQCLPYSERALADNLAAIVSHRGLLGLTGSLFFVIFSSSLFGSVRHVLNVVFKVEQRRSFFRGIGHDFVMMLVSALLLVVAIMVASLLAIVRAFGAEQLPIMTPALEVILEAVGRVLAWSLLFMTFCIFYRFAPARRLNLGSVITAGLSATILFQLARWAFTWYVEFAREALAIYGALAGLVLFFFWLYYASIIFVGGGEIGLAYETLRNRDAGALLPSRDSDSSTSHNR